MRDRALFDLAIVVQAKTGKLVQFEIMPDVRAGLLACGATRWGVGRLGISKSDRSADHLSTRQYARLLDEWVVGIGLRRSALRVSLS